MEARHESTTPSGFEPARVSSAPRKCAGSRRFCHRLTSAAIGSGSCRWRDKFFSSRGNGSTPVRGRGAGRVGVVTGMLTGEHGSAPIATCLNEPVLHRHARGGRSVVGGEIRNVAAHNPCPTNRRRCCGRWKRRNQASSNVLSAHLRRQLEGERAGRSQSSSLLA